MIDGQYIVNPNSAQREKSAMHLTVSGTKDAVMMVEAGAKMVSEAEMLEGILFAHEQIKKIIEFIETIVAEVGKPKKDYPIYHVGEDIEAAVREFALDRVVWSADTFDRYERQDREAQVKQETLEHFAEIFPGREKEIGDVLYNMTKNDVKTLFSHHFLLFFLLEALI